MDKTEFNLSKSLFEQKSGTKISRSTWYNNIGILKSFGYEVTSENIEFLASIRKITPCLSIALEGYQQFKKSSLFNINKCVSRFELYEAIKKSIGKINPKTFKRWLKKAKVLKTEIDKIPPDKLHSVYVSAYVYLIKFGGKFNAA